MRRFTFASFVFALSLLLAARSATAGDDRPPPRFLAGARGALGVGVGDGGYMLMQLEAGYRIIPLVLVGASFEHALESWTQSDSCADGNFCPPAISAFGARAELQPFPTFIVGPWLGAELGLNLLHLPHPGAGRF